MHNMNNVKFNQKRLVIMLTIYKLITLYQDLSYLKLEFLISKQLYLNMQRTKVKNSMKKYFEQPDIALKIKQYIEDNKLDVDEVDDKVLVKILNQLELLNPVLTKLDHENKTDKAQQQSFNFDKLRLRLTIQSARMFLGMDNLNCNFFISAMFLNQRFKSKLIKCDKEPSVYEVCELNIEKSDLKLQELRNIQLAIVTQQIESNDKKVYAIKDIDWRFVMVLGQMNFDIELASYSNPNISVGLINIKLELLPKTKEKNRVSETLLNKQFQLQKKTKEKVNTEFYSYCTEFWNDYKSIHPTFMNRPVPLYRQSEDRVFVHACKYIFPLYNVRGIDSPFHALRFVSLILFQKEEVNSKSLYKRFHTLVSSGSGNVLDHCHLLCSLLLGFGLNAYVCTGYSHQGQHSWVMTLGKQNQIWQSLNGMRFNVDSEKGKFYKAVYTLYNDASFYANIQMNEMIGAVSFDLQNQTKWKSIPKQKIQGLFPFNNQLALFYPNINTYTLEQDIQNKLSQQISLYRKEYRLEFKFDNKLKSLLATALANYQYERVVEQTFGETEFQESIRRYIPQKHTFKAFPIQIQETNSEKILNILKANKVSNEILLTRGDSVFFALRCKVIVYPDNYKVVWLSLACRYYKLL